MAQPVPYVAKAFSIANFKKLFNESKARQYMSEMDVAQVRQAIDDKDIMLLGQLYDVLLQEQMTNEEIVRDFVMTKNKILDDFAVTVRNIDQTMGKGAQKQIMATQEKQEQNSAEDILKNL